MTEIWKPIAGHEGAYEISDAGRVRSLPRKDFRGHPLSGRVLRPNRCTNGYLAVHLRRDGRTHPRLIHQLVLAAFAGSRPPGMEACHNNGSRGDNRAVNLRWDTKRNNFADKRAHGTNGQGEQNPMAKLSDAQVAEIIRLRNSGWLLKNLAAAFGITAGHASEICNGKKRGNFGQAKE